MNLRYRLLHICTLHIHFIYFLYNIVYCIMYKSTVVFFILFFYSHILLSFFSPIHRAPILLSSYPPILLCSYPPILLFSVLLSSYPPILLFSYAPIFLSSYPPILQIYHRSTLLKYIVLTLIVKITRP